MEYIEMLITPEWANDYLARNETNRRYEHKTSERYAKEMANGNWQHNGEDIAISVSNKLKNGQHRLNAVIIYGKPVLMGVKFGVPDDISIYDRGRCRSTSDVFTMKGFDKELSNKRIIAVAKLHFQYTESCRDASDSEIEKFIIKHQELLKLIYQLSSKRNNSRNGKINCSTAPLLLSAFYALNYGVEYNKLDDFFRILSTGIPDNLNQTPAIILRNDIISGIFKSNGGGGRLKAIPIIEKSIFDFVKGVNRKVSYKNCSDKIYSIFFKE